MSILICGSLAFDTIMVFPDRFERHILPEKIHKLNVAFLVPEMRREFGGCAGNIAWNLKLLEESPLIMAACGQDFAPYAQHLDRHGISREHILAIENAYTAQAFITTDLTDNQITAFHPGAMTDSHRNQIEQAGNVRLGIVAPDGREGMIAHAKAFHAAGIPFVFDPGQGMPMFDGAELLQFIEWADYVAVNDYEAEMLQQRVGISLDELAKKVRALIVTRGEAGSEIFTATECISIPCAEAAQVIDPTGCGDAYRAGLLYGISHHWHWEQTGKLASLMGAIKIEHRGGQNHHPTFADIVHRYETAFAETFPGKLSAS